MNYISWLKALLEVFKKSSQDGWWVCLRSRGAGGVGSPFAFDPDSLMLPNHSVVFPPDLAPEALDLAVALRAGTPPRRRLTNSDRTV